MESNINFIAYAAPSLPSGDYKLTVTQSLDNVPDSRTYFSAPVVHAFHVDAPQFVLPDTDVVASLPGPDGVGDYTWVLPQVLLNRATLPWLRDLNPDPDPDQNKKVPWLALLVLRDDEVIWNPATQSPIFPTTVGNLASSLPPNVYFPSVTPNSAGEPSNTPIQTMRIRTSDFNTLMPQQTDLALLCHCREVTANPGNRQGEVNRTLAAVLANRFPPAGRCHCFLVSMEGYYPMLTGSQSFSKTQAQFICLKYWNFLNQPDGINGFLNGLGNPGSNASKLLLRVPVTTTISDPNIAWRLNSGYVPIQYAVDADTTTFAWYRGPFTAQVPQPIPPEVDDLITSDAAMIYSKPEHVFDHSYSAAWETGRNLALADPNFAKNILAFRKESYRLLGLLVDRLRISSMASTQDLRQVVESNAVYNAFDAMISSKVTEFVANFSRNGVGQMSPNPLPQGKRKSRLNATDSPEQIARSFLALPEVQAALGELVGDKLLPVAAWLAELQLLCKVPFHHLVPDQRMLPPNSVRFFYLDQSWLDSLLDGAKSVGVQGSQDTLFYKAMHGVIDDAIQKEMNAYMTGISGTPTGDKLDGSNKEAMSGMLIRSSVIKHYPNLQIVGSKGTTELKILRKERLSDTVMLVIWLDLPTNVVISEPQSGLGTGADNGKILLRITSGNELGRRGTIQFPSNNGSFSKYFRVNVPAAVGYATLNLSTGTPNLISDLQAALLRTTPLDAADLALQLTLTPDLIQIQTNS